MGIYATASLVQEPVFVQRTQPVSTAKGLDQAQQDQQLLSKILLTEPHHKPQLSSQQYARLNQLCENPAKLLETYFALAKDTVGSGNNPHYAEAFGKLEEAINNISTTVGVLKADILLLHRAAFIFTETHSDSFQAVAYDAQTGTLVLSDYPDIPPARTEQTPSAPAAAKTKPSTPHENKLAKKLAGMDKLEWSTLLNNILPMGQNLTPTEELPAPPPGFNREQVQADMIAKLEARLNDPELPPEEWDNINAEITLVQTMSDEQLADRAESNKQISQINDFANKNSRNM